VLAKELLSAQAAGSARLPIDLDRFLAQRIRFSHGLLQVNPGFPVTNSAGVMSKTTITCQ
jgi:hypothetical protein